MSSLFFLVIYGPGLPFVGHPGRSNIVAIGFTLLLGASIARSRKVNTLTHLLLLASVVLWMLSALWDIHAQQQGWNIRVDLLVVWPILFVVSIAAAWRGIRGLAWRKAQPTDLEKSPRNPDLCVDPLR